MSALWSDPVFGPLARKLYRGCGLVFEGGQAVLFRRRVSRRAEERGYESPEGYLAEIACTGGELEYEHLIDLLTVNETYFFREEEHFHTLVGELWPEWAARGDPAIRIWSAACSTGCEPYTLAILLHERGLLGPQRPRVEIVGTDVNTRVLHEARRGAYAEFALRRTSTYYRERYFKREGPLYHLRPEIRQMVGFHKYNLLRTEPKPFGGGFHAVLCRNVLIYFDVEAKRRVVADLTRALRPEGVLLVGRSESLFNVPEAPRIEKLGGILVHRAQ